MNNTIWKYELKVTDSQEIQLPKGANVLCIQLQLGQPCLWAEVNSHESQKDTYHVETYGTGHQLPSSTGTYIGTYQMQNGALVFHVYYKLKPVN